MSVKQGGNQFEMILLLEDDENLNRGISLRLEKEGYKVHSNFGVREAIGCFNSQDIDLVIMI